MDVSNNSNLGFRASLYRVELAKANGANSCPHAMGQVNNLVCMMQEIKQGTKKPISIVMVGKNVVERAVAGLPKNVSKKVKDGVANIAKFLSEPYRACSGKCSKAGLTNGEVISNVFAIWDKKSNVSIGNPFVIKTTDEKDLSNAEIIKQLKKSEKPYDMMREILGIKKPSSFGDANSSIRESLKEVGVDPEDVNTTIARRAKTLDD